MKQHIIFCPSIPHTGTRFLTDKILGDLGYKRYNLLTLEDVYAHEKKVVLHSHFHRRRFKDICKNMEKYPVIMPLRKPVNVALSWQKREADMNKFFIQSLLGYYLIKQYRPLISLLPIEEKDIREQYLNDMEKKLNLKLKTNWEVFQTIGTTHPIIKPLGDKSKETLDVLTYMYNEILEINRKN